MLQELFSHSGREDNPCISYQTMLKFHIVRALCPGHGWVPEWPKGTDCKSAANCFGGSNPPPSIARRGERVLLPYASAGVAE